MRKLLLCILVLAACDRIVAIAPDGSTLTDAATDAAIDAAPLTPACVGPDDLSCGEAATVATREELVAIAALCTDWGVYEIDSDRLRTPTIRVTSSFTVCGSEFSIPNDCERVNDMDCVMQIDLDENLIGAAFQTACGSGTTGGVTLSAGTRFRVRYLVDGPFGINQPKIATIRFERACDADCATNPAEYRCEINSACYGEYNVCFDCGRGTLAECACQTAEGTQIGNGQGCSWNDNGSLRTGTCQDGVCTR